VALERKEVPIHTFIVDEFGAPSYPELVLTTSRRTLEDEPELVEAVVGATRRGYDFTQRQGRRALNDLLAANPALDRLEQGEQLSVLIPYLRPLPFDPATLRAWAAWDLEHGLLQRPLDVDAAFDLPE
jgi:ABC-type nitrate/sulfonate/bicarbonate transport system substrate-binding protein